VEASIFIISYAIDHDFLTNPLVMQARQNVWYRQLHSVLEKVFTDAGVRLAMKHDLIAAESQAAWNGRPATPMMVTGCLAVVKKLMGWSYRTLMQEVDVSVGWRWVCGLYAHDMPDFRTLRDREAMLKPATVRRINDKVIAIAQAIGYTDGSRLRMDGTVTESNIHYPSDSSLLDDAARVLSRCVRRAGKVIGERRGVEKAWFRDRHRQAHRLARDIAQQARKVEKGGQNQRVGLYRQLLQVIQALLDQVERVLKRLRAYRGRDAQRLVSTLDHYVPLVQQVVEQARQRILQGHQVAATDKLVSLFEPHTYIIRRGKAKPHETEFGHKVWLAEINGGFISDYRLLDGNPPEAQQVIPTLKRHRRKFGRAPKVITGDRALYSPDNEAFARKSGVKQVCLAKPGYKSPDRRRREHQPWFRAALRFRNGIEGRISQLRRVRGLRRCLSRGFTAMERWIGWGVIANNIATLVTKLMKRRSSLQRLLA
jgi:transposase, IS5 family